VPRRVLGGAGYQAPSDTLNVAIVGAGGMGAENAQHLGSENIVAVCDIDHQLVENKVKEVMTRGDGTPREEGVRWAEQYERAAKYTHYEAMLEEQPDIDTLIDDWNRSGVLQTVYFAYDSSDLSDSGRRALRNNADWLKSHADVAVLVEGNCDERGTIEYNLALGEHRADAVRNYLTSLGLSRARVRIITYGEERPIDPSHNEAAWAKNRRAAFVVEPQR